MVQPERAKRLNDEWPRDGDYVLYWMQASQRAEWNHALEYAIAEANQRKLPVAVLFGLTDAAHAVAVKDIDVSMVAYHAATQQSPRVWIVFEGKKGKEIELQLGVPLIERLKGVRPTAAVTGPGLPQWKGEFEVPPGLGGVVFGTAGGPEPKTFHEPFTGTNSWLFEKRKLVLPETGRY